MYSIAVQEFGYVSLNTIHIRLHPLTLPPTG